jgi:hypothetical protein
MLVLSPRIFADAFYNDKDIVFLSAFLLSTLSMVYFLLSATWKRGLVHAIASAISIDTRLIAVAIPVLTLALLSLRSAELKWPKIYIVKVSTFYLLATGLAIILFWPYLWSNPFGHFIEAFKFISHHPHSAALIFQGKEILTNQLPWYYIPSWIAISTPILYLISFIVGSLVIIKKLFKVKLRLFENQDRLLDFIFLGLFFGPIISISITHLSIYNGWRHLYFIYPFFILIAVSGLMEVWKKINFNIYGKIFGIIVIFANSAWLIIWMTINHPLQNLYFNSLAGKNWGAEYEVDYWGLASRVALKKILSVDNSESLSIWPGTQSKFKSGEHTVFSDQLMLEQLKNKSRVTSPDSPEESKYLIASQNGIYPPKYLAKHGMFQKIDSVSVDGQEILAIFLKKNFNELPGPRKNQSLFFAQSGEGIFYLYGNKNPPINWENWKSNEWQIPESWGTWSSGQTASLTIPIPNQNISKMIIKMRAFISPQIPSQNIEVWINGDLIDKLNIANNASQEFMINLPKNINKNKEIQIKFANLKPLSPKALGLSQDDRQIAIGLESISLN